MHAGLLSTPRGRSAFTAVKYLTYTLLLTNVFFFLREELLALEHTFTGPMSAAEFVQVFSATIDTAAWVILLLLFELETCILDDERIRGATRYAIHGIRAVCSVAICWAFSGYCAELLTLYRVTPMPGWDACAAAATESWSVVVDLDEYVPLDGANCLNLVDGAFRIDSFQIVASAPMLQSIRWLAWTDVINAATWILVVIVLEVEVRLQLKGRLTDAVVRVTGYLKYLLYSTLFVAAAYWGYAGDFIDFWDASLWLFAFIFIELNVFDWQQETATA